MGSVFERFSDQLGDLRSQLGEAASNFLLSTGDILISAAGFVAALVTVLTLTFFLLLGSERNINALVGLFAEAHRPLVRRLLEQSAAAVTGYVSGNLAISAICGVVTFVVLVVLGMPYAAALALLVACWTSYRWSARRWAGRCSSSWGCSSSRGRPWCCSST
jgi:predicted PurR-regulated permease PerM